MSHLGPNTIENDTWRMLLADNKAMKTAGNNLAIAAARVAEEYDGVHRLRLALADWYKVMADEGGRG